MADSSNTNLTARVGVEQVRSLLVSELGWYPREPSDPDYGIDVYVECADDGIPNGRLFGIQAKSGESFFTEETDAGIVFRGDSRHLEYWLNHSLPVVLVLYEPSAKTAYWQVINPDTVEGTGKGWKVVVPRTQVLDGKSADALSEIAEGDPYILQLNQLRSERTWMNMLRDGSDVFIEVAEWVNKTSGRGNISLIGSAPDGGDPVIRARAVYFGLAPYADLLPRLFPWAELSVDEDVYDRYEEDQWQLDEGHYDKEEGKIVVYGDSFSAWREHLGLTGLRPYTVEADEVARWRLRLELNSLGDSFLTLDDHLNRGLE